MIRINMNNEYVYHLLIAGIMAGIQAHKTCDTCTLIYTQYTVGQAMESYSSLSINPSLY